MHVLVTRVREIRRAKRVRRERRAPSADDQMMVIATAMARARARTSRSAAAHYQEGRRIALERHSARGHASAIEPSCAPVSSPCRAACAHRWRQRRRSSSGSSGSSGRLQLLRAAPPPVTPAQRVPDYNGSRFPGGGRSRGHPPASRPERSRDGSALPERSSRARPAGESGQPPRLALAPCPGDRDPLADPRRGIRASGAIRAAWPGA